MKTNLKRSSKVFLFVASLACMLSSCKKSLVEALVPGVTTDASFSYTISGGKFNNTKIDASQRSGTVSVAGNDKNNSDSGVYIDASDKNSKSTTTLNLSFNGKTTGTFDFATSNCALVLSIDDLSVYFTAGTLKVDSYGSVGGTISGTFSGTLSGVVGQSVVTYTVTDGKFSSKRSL